MTLADVFNSDAVDVPIHPFLVPRRPSPPRSLASVTPPLRPLRPSLVRHLFFSPSPSRARSSRSRMYTAQ